MIRLILTAAILLAPGSAIADDSKDSRDDYPGGQRLGAPVELKQDAPPPTPNPCPCPPADDDAPKGPVPPGGGTR